ncbi:MAG: D-glutamate cyclase family protein, partial [Burkholderiales bacterium]
PVDGVPEGKIAVFWACGVTPQAATEAAGIDLMIAHAPAHSFVTDLLADHFCQP